VIMNISVLLIRVSYSIQCDHYQLFITNYVIRARDVQQFHIDYHVNIWLHIIRNVPDAIAR